MNGISENEVVPIIRGERRIRERERERRERERERERVINTCFVYQE